MDLLHFFVGVNHGQKFNILLFFTVTSYVQCPVMLDENKASDLSFLYKF